MFQLQQKLLPLLLQLLKQKKLHLHQLMMTQLKQLVLLVVVLLDFFLLVHWVVFYLLPFHHMFLKKNDETGEAVRGFGKTSLEVYNYLTKLNGKYEITDKISTTVSKQLDSLDVESDSVDKIKSAV